MTATERARIRELVATEAEVADLYERMWAQNDRAEKAEAEVERLRADLVHAVLKLQPDAGGGRDSGLGRDSVAVKSASDAALSADESRAAVNPAACLDPKHGHVGSCPSCGWTAARKVGDPFPDGKGYVDEIAARKEARP